MTSSDAPQPPGGPLRQDAPEGDFAPDEEREDLPEASDDHGSGGGSDEGGDLPAVSHEPQQSEQAAAVQEENAETSLDQPSQ